MIVVTLFKFFDADAAATIKTSAISEIFSEIFAWSRENISALNSSASRSNYILKSQDLSKQTTCYNCNEIDYFANNCSHFSKRE